MLNYNRKKITFRIILFALGISILFLILANQENNIKFKFLSYFTKTYITLSTLTQDERIIFFLETSSRDFLQGRAACSVESAARAHPKYKIVLLHLEPKWNNSYPTTTALKKLSNVVFYPIQMEEILNNTPIQDWIISRPWQKSKYKVELLSNILSMSLLIKYGGIYLDSDIIVRKSLMEFRNTAGGESSTAFDNAVMIFDKGNSFLRLCEKRLRNVSDWNQWGIVGPLLYTHILQEKCNVDNLEVLQNRLRCEDIDVPAILSKNIFYPIPYSNWWLLFDSAEADYTLTLIQNSYVVHTWNSLSSKEPIKFGSGQPYELLAQDFCPIIYDIMKIYNFQ